MDFSADQQLRRPPRRSNRKWAFMLTLVGLAVVVGIVAALTVLSTSNAFNKPMSSGRKALHYQDEAEKIIQYCTGGDASGKAYDFVANISDTFGPRKIGSEALEKAIDYSVKELSSIFGAENVHTEEVTLPNWVRGEETAYLISPLFKRLSIIGLGSTVGTEGGNLTAEAIVVTSWEDLDTRCSLSEDDGGIRDKIVVYNHQWDGKYGTASKFRTQGASRASKCGAVASLVRSATPLSVYSPHTGIQYYADGVAKIPTVSIAPEDADFLERMQNRRMKLTITLFMSSYNDEANPIISRNTIFDLPGAELPQEMVMISGHFDSWDVGTGAMDNCAGASVAMRAIANLKELITQQLIPAPKRTIRGVFWTAEEPGMLGSEHYYNQHKNDSAKYVFLQEADEGFFRPLSLLFSGSETAKSMFQERIYPLITSLNISLESGSLGDSGWWARDGVPGVMMASAGEGYQRYFTFHHSQGDTPSVYGRTDLDAPTAIWAVLAYVIADMNQTLPLRQL